MLKIRFQETNCIFWGPDFQDFTDQNVCFHFLQGQIELNDKKYNQSNIIPCVLYRPLYINNILLFWPVINIYTYQ